jgi:hypothetical protein
LQVLSDKDGVGCDKAELGDDDGTEDNVTHPWAVELPANITEGSRDSKFGLDEQQIGVERNNGNESKCDGREKDSTVIKTRDVSANRKEREEIKGLNAFPRNNTPVPIKDLSN